MPESDFTAVWDRLPAELCAAFLRNPARALGADDVDALVRAGGRHAHALWLEDRRGRPKQWRTSWGFQRFAERARDARPPARGPRPRLWSAPTTAPERD